MEKTENPFLPVHYKLQYLMNLQSFKCSQIHYSANISTQSRTT